MHASQSISVCFNTRIQNNSSAIAEMARVFFVDLDHGIVESPILDANNVHFYATTTLWCPSLNLVVSVMVPLHELMHFSVLKCSTAGFRPWGTITSHSVHNNLQALAVLFQTDNFGALKVW